ncbi:MAG: hypothetical protein LBQ88_06890 [Treponema sp.]|nr:hypothetical protein [Treponema sp.]
MQAHREAFKGCFEGVSDPEGGFVFKREANRPAGFDIGHRQGVAELA